MQMENKMLKKIHIILGMLLFTSLGFAKEIFPEGCSAQSIDQPNIEISKGRHRLFFLHNLTNTHIWLANRENARLTVEMQPGQWNVLYVPRTSETWKCVQATPGHEQQVPCQSGIALCEWDAKIAKSKRPKQSIWLAENTSYAEAKAYLQRIGWLFNGTASK